MTSTKNPRKISECKKAFRFGTVAAVSSGKDLWNHSGQSDHGLEQASY